MHRSATVQTCGRVTLPLGIREALHIGPGDEVVFVQTSTGGFEVKAEARRAALLNRPRVSRLEVPIRRRPPQMELQLPGVLRPARGCRWSELSYIRRRDRDNYFSTTTVAEGGTRAATATCAFRGSADRLSRCSPRPGAFAFSTSSGL